MLKLVLSALGAFILKLLHYRKEVNLTYWRVTNKILTGTVNLRWCCARDLLGSQIPVTTGRFELPISFIQSRYLIQQWVR